MKEQIIKLLEEYAKSQERKGCAVDVIYLTITMLKSYDETEYMELKEDTMNFVKDAISNYYGDSIDLYEKETYGNRKENC